MSLAGLPAGTAAGAVGAGFAGDASDAPTSASGDLDVAQGTPRLSWANPADIVYGTPLGSAQLDASASIPGTFTYTPAAGNIPPAGTALALSAMFIPTDSADYNTVTTGTTLTVTPAPLTITANDATKTVGTAQTFSSAAFTATGLANGDTVTGVTETSPGAPPSAASGTYAIFPSAATGSGLNNYTINYANGTLTVNAPSPPVFTGESRTTLKIKKKKVTDFVLTFSEPLSTPGGVYQVTQAGKTRKSPLKHVPVTSMTLGTGGTSVMLTLGKYTTGKLLTLMGSGLIGANGQPVKSFVTSL
jgi:hypothetical protein